MATAHTARLIVVARVAIAVKANEAAKQVDTAGGERTFTSPLRLKGDATNAIRAYWCGWTMTPSHLTSIRQRLKEKGMTDAEVVVVTQADKPTFVPVPTAKTYLFDAREGQGWTPQEVLDALGLDTLAVAL